jgi:hypothetical protein
MSGQIKLRNIHAGLKTWIRSQNTGFGMAVGSRTIFVDAVSGSDNYSGFDDPASAKATVEAALALAGAQDVIYIAPGGAMSGGDPVAYRKSGSNHLIAATTYGLAMIGLTHSGLIGFPMDPQIKIADSIGTPIITCYAPYCAFENLAFNTGGSNSYPALAFENGETATSNANNISIFNCYFRNAGGTGANGNTGGAIYITGGMGFNINHCMFYNCRHGISAKSGTEVCENVFIHDVTFLASSVNNIASDIYLYFQGQNYTTIDLVRICHDAPNYTGSVKVPIVAVGGGEVGLISRVYCVDANGTSHATTGTVIRVTTTMGCSEIYDGDNNLLAVS